MQARKLGADHPNALTLLNNLALAYEAAGQLPRAITLLEQASAGIEKRRYQHEYAGRIIPNTVRAYERAKQPDRAEVWQRKWVAVVEERSGGSSTAHAVELVNLASTLLQQQKWIEAEAVLRESLTILEKERPDSWSTFYTRSMLGEALMGQKNYTEAEPLLVQAYEALKQREAKIPKERKPRLTEALKRIVQLYDSWGKQDMATRWRKELEPGKEP